jgi:hypothetical protein
VQRIVKKKEWGEYMKRELGKCLELFLGFGKHYIREVGKEEEEMREKKEEEDPYTRWKIRSSKSISLVKESTVRKLDNLGDNKRRRENTLGELRCCSNPCCKKTKENNVIRLLKLVNGELNRKLSRELTDIKLLKPLVDNCLSLNSGNMTL